MKHVLLAALVGVLALPAAALAKEEALAVRAGDLSLSQPAHAHRMLRRLDQAALDVCGASIVSLKEHQRAVRRSGCYAQAMETAVATLNAPALDALYRQRGRTYAAR
jgi:UrcA family protein